MYLEGFLILGGIICIPLSIYLMIQMKKLSKYTNKLEIDYLNAINWFNEYKGKDLEELKRVSKNTPLYKYISHRHSSMPYITDMKNNTNYTPNDKEPWI